MKYVAPHFYKHFHCLAGQCLHTCCAEWEIDIDEKTHALYQSISGEFGTRLSDAIETNGDSVYFRLDVSERCPFLNRENLCDIILTLGEEALCQICRDHPRFRNFFSDRTEIGLGLCCESAGKLLLGTTEKIRFVTLTHESDTVEINPDKEESYFFECRQKIFVFLQDRTQHIESRLKAVLSFCDTTLPQNTPAQWAEIFLQLERLDDVWTQNLQELQIAPKDVFQISLPQETDIFFEQLAVYFIYRHLAGALTDGLFSARAALSVLSVQIISYFCKLYFWHHNILPLATVTEFARLYSSEIEYSSKNTDTLLSIL